jgi:hypothetical protein
MERTRDDMHQQWAIQIVAMIGRQNHRSRSRDIFQSFNRQPRHQAYAGRNNVIGG